MTVLFQFSVLPKARQVLLHFGEFSYKIYKTCVRFFFEGIVVRSREADHISCCWSERKQISFTHFFFFKIYEYKIKEELVLNFVCNFVWFSASIVLFRLPPCDQKLACNSMDYMQRQQCVLGASLLAFYDSLKYFSLQITDSYWTKLLLLLILW